MSKSDTKQEQFIHKEMTIEEIFETFPQKGQRLAQVLSSAGLQCVGCGAATWETLEAGCLGHGLSESQLQELLDKLNQICAEKIDESTITVTKRAAEKFLSILKQDQKEGYALRFGDKPGGCGGYEYILDFSKEAGENDVVYHSNGIDIHVNEAQIERLLGSEIDYQDGLQGSGFKISNPNVRSSCSCGSSQSY